MEQRMIGSINQPPAFTISNTNLPLAYIMIMAVTNSPLYARSAFGIDAISACVNQFGTLAPCQK